MSLKNSHFGGKFTIIYLDSIFFFCSDKKKKKKRLIENEEDEEAGVTNPSMVSSREGGLWIRVGITTDQHFHYKVIIN